MGNCNHYEGVDCWVCKDQKRRIEELEAELVRRVDHGKTLREQVPSYAELKALTDRLTSRGFEDLHHENTELRAQLDEVRREKDSFRPYISGLQSAGKVMRDWLEGYAEDLDLIPGNQFHVDIHLDRVRAWDAALAADSDKGEPDAAD